MKKYLYLFFAVILIISFGTHTLTYAEELDRERKKLREVGDRGNTVYEMTQNSDILGALPPIIIIDEKGLRAVGVFTYPNYDNSRLGIWDLEWVFTPEDDRYEPVSGAIRIDVRPREPEEIDEPTPPSLTATTVSLAKSTSYDINLNNKITGTKYKWTSSNSDVAKVNPKNGLVTAVSEGMATITCEITLPDGSVQTLSSEVVIDYDDNATILSDTELDLEKGDKYILEVENSPAGAKYKFVSSDKTVAKVGTTNGKVTAMGVGEAYITCTITTPEKQVIVLRCDVSVTE